MSITSLLQDEQISIFADDEQKNIMLEVSSSGEDVDRIIKALIKAKEYIA